MQTQSAQSVGKWHQTSVDPIMSSHHENVDPSFLGLQDYNLWHPIIHNLLYNNHPNTAENPCVVGYWFSEIDGHGMYPPDDLKDLDWQVVLNTCHYHDNYHIIKVAYANHHMYVSISLFGCSQSASPTEYCRLQPSHIV